MALTFMVVYLPQKHGELPRPSLLVQMRRPSSPVERSGMHPARGLALSRKPADYISSGCDNCLVFEIKKTCGNCSRPVAGIFSQEMFDVEDKVK